MDSTLAHSPGHPVLRVPHMTATRPSPPWRDPIRRRLATLWFFKMVGTAGGISLFFPVYFWMMGNPLGRPVHTVPLLDIDLWIPVQAWAFWPYASLWIYVTLAAALARDAAELHRFARSALFLCAIGLAGYAVFPTAVPAWPIDWSRYPTLLFMKSRDGGANAFPSLHVGFAVLSATFVHRELRACAVPMALRWLNLSWGGLIVYSVFGTKQHVLIDAVGGVAAALLALRFGVRFPRRPFAKRRHGKGNPANHG